MQPVTDEDVRRAGTQFVETGADVERLAVALIVAHCQHGRDLNAAIDLWFPLLDAPDPSSGRFTLPWSGSGARLRYRHERVWLVDGAAAMVFGGVSGRPDVPDPAELMEVAGRPARPTLPARGEHDAGRGRFRGERGPYIRRKGGVQAMNEQQLEEARLSCEQIIDRVAETFVGNRLLLRKLLAAALANGHVLFEDYPGLGKTLLAKLLRRPSAATPSACSSHPTCFPPTSWA